jgi:hypothetical protein
MESSSPARVLVVANRTAATPALIEAVRDRARQGKAQFTLLVPHFAHGLHKVVDAPDTDIRESQEVIELAVPLLEEAAGSRVEAKIGDPEPLAAIQDALNVDGYDEVIISTLPARVSRWLRMDLVSKARGLGVPVTHVEAQAREEAPSA